MFLSLGAEMVTSHGTWGELNQREYRTWVNYPEGHMVSNRRKEERVVLLLIPELTLIQVSLFMQWVNVTIQLEVRLTGRENTGVSAPRPVPFYAWTTPCWITELVLDKKCSKSEFPWCFLSESEHSQKCASVCISGWHGLEVLRGWHKTQQISVSARQFFLPFLFRLLNYLFQTSNFNNLIFVFKRCSWSRSWSSF